VLAPLLSWAVRSLTYGLGLPHAGGGPTDYRIQYSNTDLTQSSHGRDAFLHGVWGRGRPSPGSHHGLSSCKDTTKPRRTSSDVRISTWSTSEDGKLLLKMHATGRRSGATTSGSCEAGSYKWMIWSSSGCLAGRA
jgi:hypothetical protein